MEYGKCANREDSHPQRASALIVMKINLLKSDRREEGSAFLLAMLLVIIVIPLAISYLAASQQQYRLADRSQTWSSALPTAEAGLEEAFAHLNRECYSNIINGGNLTWNSNQWTGSTWAYTNSSGVTGTAKGLKSPKRYLGTNYYQVSIITNTTTDSSISATRPEIVSIGYSPSSMRVNGSSFASRQIRVKAQIFFYNAYGIKSVGDITSTGGGLTLGAYDPYADTNNMAGVYTNKAQIISSVAMASVEGNIEFKGQGTVYGSVATSPYMTNSVGSKTTIGDMAWVTNGNTGTQTGHYDNTLNSEVLDPPFDSNAASSWTLLSACNCTASYTNVTVVPMKVVTNTPPNPMPAGGVSTNDSGVYTTETWPSAIDPSLITTNLIAITNSLSKPLVTATNVFNLSTNASSVTLTNPAAAGPPYTSWPSYPTNYVGTPQQLTQVVTNYLSTEPPAQAVVGSWQYMYKKTNGTDVIDVQNVGTKKNPIYQTNYTYTWLKGYSYQTPGSYNWNYYVYKYTTTTYTYMGPKPENTTIVTGNYEYVVSGGNYKTSGNLSLSGSMLIKGHVVIYVAGKFSMSGNAGIVIPYGSSLTFYFGGDVDMKGNAGVETLSGRAQDFTMWGLPDCTKFDIAGNAAFTGTLYAPEADVSLKGSGKSNFDIVGSITGKTVTANGKFQVMWPTDLGYSGPMAGFVASNWTEEKVGVGP
jgi:Tfp pilus assembly protein PilX